uniref:Replication protein A OB domain-containing protein n=1 Tax=Solanum lycopersicum TaxID=4081 RepID=A0A3Q7FJ83_SOLLC
MVLRLDIDQIELTTRDWICKIQIVEIRRQRESLDKKCRFQNLILEDEQECQIKAVLYADEIEQYEKMLKLKPLPPPTKLSITTFNRIPHMMLDSAVEIDILAIALRCGSQKYAGHCHHKCREIIICDNQKNQFLLTLWEDLGEIEGNEIEAKME